MREKQANRWWAFAINIASKPTRFQKNKLLRIFVSQIFLRWEAVCKVNLATSAAGQLP
jgi:hypothetical protein